MKRKTDFSLEHLTWKHSARKIQNSVSKDGYHVWKNIGSKEKLVTEMKNIVLIPQINFSIVGGKHLIFPSFR